MIIRSSVLVLLFGFMPVSYASDFYVGVYAGISDHSSDIGVVDNALEAPGFDIIKDYQTPDDVQPHYAINFGYKLGKDLAIELGITKISEYEGDRRTFIDLTKPIDPADPFVDNPDTDLVADEIVKTDYLSFSFIGEWPIQQRIALHAKLGFAAWKYTYTQVLTDIDPVTAEETEFRFETFSDTGVDILYGVGLAYAVNQTFEIRLDVEAHSFSPQFTNIDIDADLTMISLGVITHF